MQRFSQILRRLRSMRVRTSRPNFYPSLNSNQVENNRAHFRNLRNWNMDARKYLFCSNKEVNRDEETPLITTANNNQIHGISAKEKIKVLTQSDSQKQVEELFDVVLNDYKQLYSENKRFTENAFYQLLLKEGTDWNDISQSPKQMRITRGSSLESDSGKELCVFFPNNITQQIFKKCEELLLGERILMTAQQGLGKTYSLALYVYLKRKMKDCRVFFIHNSDNFLLNPFSVFYKEAQIAFAEELQHPEVKKALERVRDMNLNGNLQEKLNSVETFLVYVRKHLDVNKIDLRMITDQFNVFGKELNKNQAEIANQILGFMKNWLPTFRDIRVASKTYEEIISRTQELPEHELKPPLEMNDSLKSYMKYLCNSELLTDEMITQITQVTGFIPLEVRIFFQFSYRGKTGHDLSSIAAFKVLRLEWISSVVESFIEKDRQQRLFHAILALEAMMSDGKYNPSMRKTKIDQRFMYVDIFNGAIHPLTPLVKEALAHLILEANSLDRVIKLFEGNPSIMGFILEITVQQNFMNWLYSDEFLTRTDDELNKVKNCELIKKGTPIKNFRESYRSNVLEIIQHEGYHILHPRFPAIDGILVETERITMIQIKRISLIKDAYLSDYITAINSVVKLMSDNNSFKIREKEIYKTIQANPEARGAVTKMDMIEYFVFEAIKQEKSLNIVFIMKPALTEFYSSKITVNGKTIYIKFFQLDTMTALNKSDYQELTRKELSGEVDDK